MNQATNHVAASSASAGPNSPTPSDIMNLMAQPRQPDWDVPMPRNHVARQQRSPTSSSSSSTPNSNSQFSSALAKQHEEKEGHSSTLWNCIIREWTPKRFSILAGASKGNTFIREETARSIETYLNRAAHYHIESAARGWETTKEEDTAVKSKSAANLPTSSEFDEFAIPDFRAPSEIPIFHLPSRHSIRARYPKGVSPFLSFIRFPISERSQLFSIEIINEWYCQVSEKINIPAETQSELEKEKLQMVMGALLNQLAGFLHTNSFSEESGIGARQLSRVFTARHQPSNFFIHLGCTVDGISVQRSRNGTPYISDTQLTWKEFPSEAKAMSEMNAQSWYQSTERIEQVAQEFVSGVRTSSEVDIILRRYHIRPLQFLGRRNRYINNGSRLYLSSSCRAGLVSFLISDSVGVNHEWRVEYAHRTIHNVSVPSPIINDSGVSVGHVKSVYLTGAPYRIDKITFEPSTVKEFAPYISEEQQRQLDEVHQFPLHERVVGATASVDTAEKQQTNERDAVTNALRDLFLTAAIRHVIPFTEFSRYGPTLYEDNHTPQVKRDFTAAMIDASMSTAEMELLPSVILTLISEYHTLPLPFLEEEAAKQMSQYPLVATHSNYPSHNSNPVETIQRRIDTGLWLTWRDGEIVTAPSHVANAPVVSSISPSSAASLSETVDEHPASNQTYFPPLFDAPPPIVSSVAPLPRPARKYYDDFVW